MSKLTASASTTVNTDAETVWKALVDPLKIKQYMFGTDVVSQWKVGGPILFKGEWEGKPYEDKGTILRIEPEKLLEYSFLAASSGLADKPENYVTVAFHVAADGGKTKVTITQEVHGGEDGRQHAESNWSMVLKALKEFLEA